MTRKYLSGLVGVVLVLGVVGAQAAPAGDPAMMRFSGVNELAQQGSFVVDLVQGRLVPSSVNRVSVAAAEAGRERASRYDTQNVTLTLGLFAVVALAMAGVASLGKLARMAGARERSPAKDTWKEAVFEMLEADLTNLDSLTHGFSGR